MPGFDNSLPGPSTKTCTSTEHVPSATTSKRRRIATPSASVTMDTDQEEHKRYLEHIGVYERGDKFKTRMEQMIADQAVRQQECLDDMMKYERAGLGPEEQKLIPKLDASNNASYRYLRSVRNMYQYDPKNTHPKLKNRLYRRFDTFDKDSDGIMTISEVCYWAERIKTLCQASKEEIEKIRKAVKIFFEACGLNESGLHRENWVEGNQTFAEAERERKRRGEPSLVAMLGNTFYDVLDSDKDKHHVSMRGLKRMMNVFRVPEEAAYTFFEKADTEKSGQLERQQLHDLFQKFWLEKYNPDLDGIYAYKY